MELIMNKIMITGFSGFVASHFVEYLYNNDLKYEIIGLDLHEPTFDYSQFGDKLAIKFYPVNLLDSDQLRSILYNTKPNYILHLAAFSSVAYSWKHPTESFTNNSNIFLNLLDAVRDTDINCRILSVGSSEEYGNVNHEDLPLRENQMLEPLSPYAIARVSQEWLSKCYVNAYDMNIVLTRSFNHIGPRQDQRFVIPSFISRIRQIKIDGKTKGTIETGNVDIIRDFVDVRDVVRAYYLLLTKGTVGEVYNICSGRAISLRNIISIIADIVGVEVNPEVNPEFIRPNDNMEIVGSNYKINAELGWTPTIKLENTLNDMIEEY